MRATNAVETVNPCNMSRPLKYPPTTDAQSAWGTELQVGVSVAVAGDVREGEGEKVVSVLGEATEAAVCSGLVTVLERLPLVQVGKARECTRGDG
jgi:hypothetical protein